MSKKKTSAWSELPPPRAEGLPDPAALAVGLHSKPRLAGAVRRQLADAYGDAPAIADAANVLQDDGPDPEDIPRTGAPAREAGR